MRRPKLLSCGAATSIDTAENQRRCSAALSHQRHHDLRFHRRLSTTAAPQRIERRKMVRSQYVKVPCDAPESRIHFAAFGSHKHDPRPDNVICEENSQKHMTSAKRLADKQFSQLHSGNVCSGQDFHLTVQSPSRAHQPRVQTRGTLVP